MVIHKTQKKVLFILSLILASNVFANGCTPISSDATLTADCNNLIWNSGNIVINSGVTISNAADAAIKGSPSLFTLNNSGSIIDVTAGELTYGIFNSGGTITLLTNNSGGFIEGNHAGIANTGSIISIVNNGTISLFPSHNNNESAIFNLGSIGTITNNGLILGTIDNLSTIDTINNLQGSGSSEALILYDKRPSHYNIIIKTSSNYGQLFINDSLDDPFITTFGISNLSSKNRSIINTPLVNVLTGITNTQLNIFGTSFTGTSNGYKYTLYEDAPSSNNWDLLILSAGPDAADTQASMQYQASQLRSAFNTQSVAANFGLNYDCSVFDSKGLCISAGGRYTSIDNPSINNSAAVVTLGYKMNPNIRIGAYLDQNINISKPTGIGISNNTPLMGLYAVWNKEQSGLGYQLRLANTYQEKDVTSTRSIFGTSEAGSGTSSLNSQSYLAELSYAFQYQDRTLVRPYFGLRYTRLKQDGYTEATTDSVTDPLTVASLSDKSASALLGIKLNYQATDKASLIGQLGLEQDLYHSVSNYSATSLNADALTPIAFNSDIKRTRPVASAGAYYEVTKTQRASATINYQQTAFEATRSATAYFNYMIGF